MAWGSVDARMVTMASLWAAQLATRGSAFKHRAAGAMRGKGVDASVACDCAVSDVNDATDEASAAGSTTPPPPAPPNDARRCVSTRGAPGLSCSGTGDSARMRAFGDVFAAAARPPLDAPRCGVLAAALPLSDGRRAGDLPTPGVEPPTLRLVMGENAFGVPPKPNPFGVAVNTLGVPVPKPKLEPLAGVFTPPTLGVDVNTLGVPIDDVGEPRCRAPTTEAPPAPVMSVRDDTRRFTELVRRRDAAELRRRGAAGPMRFTRTCGL